jgi:hypothetical protein
MRRLSRRALVEVVVAELGEVLRAEVVMILVVPVVVLGPGELEEVVVGEDRGHGHHDPHELLPALGDGAADAGAVLLVEDARCRAERDTGLLHAESALVVGDDVVDAHEEGRGGDDHRNVPEADARLALQRAVDPIKDEEVAERSERDGDDDVELGRHGRLAKRSLSGRD